MVSLWPWKNTGDSTSTFEKTLSTLSTKISKANASRENLRTRSRRLIVLWTVYTVFAYIFCTLILTLVTGWTNWGVVEYITIFGSPLVIYGIRAAVSTYYRYRLSSNQTYLEQLQSQRDEAIEKFKVATKYHSTQQLLEKYGATPKTPPSAKSSMKTLSSSPDNSTLKAQQSRRTGLAPPPTANLPRPADFPIAVSTPQQRNSQPTNIEDLEFLEKNNVNLVEPSVGEEFAANAYSDVSQYTKLNQGAWYDRLVDVLLGEDETRAINRFALICQECRLVNGQAPPGAKSLEDVGRWRCASCKAWNGEENQVDKMILVVAKSEIGQNSISSVTSPDKTSTQSETLDLPPTSSTGKELSHDKTTEESDSHLHQNSDQDLFPAIPDSSKPNITSDAED